MLTATQTALFQARPFEGMTSADMRRFSERHLGDLVRCRTLGSSQSMSDGFFTGTFLGMTDWEGHSYALLDPRRPPGIIEVKVSFGKRLFSVHDVLDFEILVTDRVQCVRCDGWDPIGLLTVREDGFCVHPHDCVE